MCWALTTMQLKATLAIPGCFLWVGTYMTRHVRCVIGCDCSGPCEMSICETLCYSSIRWSEIYIDLICRHTHTYTLRCKHGAPLSPIQNALHKYNKEFTIHDFLASQCRKKTKPFIFLLRISIFNCLVFWVRLNGAKDRSRQRPRR